MATLCDLWKELRAAPARAGSSGYRLQLADAKQTIRVYAGMPDGGGIPALLIELPAALRPTDMARITTGTFDCQLADLPGLPSGHSAIVLQLKDETFSDLFALLGEEIRTAVRTASSADSACHSVLRCVDRWRKFVERGRKALSDEEVRGLIGELVVLARCFRLHGASAAVAAWQGPTGALRDFELPDCSVEVKTYQSDTGASVRINDPQQLDVVAERPVHLAAVRLARVQTTGASLPEIVGRVRLLMTADDPARDQLDSLLAQSGYLDAQAPMYPDRYVAGPPVVFRVSEGFPRINAEQVPPGVVEVRFSLLLSALAPYQVEAHGLIGPANQDLEAG